MIIEKASWNCIMRGNYSYFLLTPPSGRSCPVLPGSIGKWLLKYIPPLDSEGGAPGLLSKEGVVTQKSLLNPAVYFDSKEEAEEVQILHELLMVGAGG